MELFHQYIYNPISRKDSTAVKGVLETEIDLNNLVEDQNLDETERTVLAPSSPNTSVNKHSAAWKVSENNTLNDTAYDFRIAYKDNNSTFVPLKAEENSSQLHNAIGTGAYLEHVKQSSSSNKLTIEPNSSHIFGLSKKKHLNSPSVPIKQNVSKFRKQLVREKRQVHTGDNTGHKHQDVKCQKVLKKISAKMHSLESRFASLERVISELKEPIETSEENSLEMSSLRTEINLSENNVLSENVNTVHEMPGHKNTEQESDRFMSERPTTGMRVVEHTNPSDTAELSPFLKSFPESELGNVSMSNVTKSGIFSKSKIYTGLFSFEHTVTVPTAEAVTSQKVEEIDKDYGFVTSITDSETTVHDPNNDSSVDTYQTESAVSRRTGNTNSDTVTEMKTFPTSLTYENETNIPIQSHFLDEATQVREFKHRSENEDVHVNTDRVMTYNITASSFEHQDMEKTSHTTKQGESEFVWEDERSETSNKNVVHINQDINGKSVGVGDLQEEVEREIQIKNGMGNTQTTNVDGNAHSHAQALNEDLSSILTVMFTSHQNPTSRTQEATEPTAERGRKPEDILTDSYHLNTRVIPENITELSIRERLENKLQEEAKNDIMSSTTGIGITEVLGMETYVITSRSQMESKNFLAINSKHGDSKLSSETTTGSNAQNKNTVLTTASNEMNGFNISSVEATSENKKHQQGESEDFVTASFKRNLNDETSLETDTVKKLQEYDINGNYVSSSMDINNYNEYEISERSLSSVTEETPQKQNENYVRTTTVAVVDDDDYGEYEEDTVHHGTTARNELLEQNENNNFFTPYVDAVNQTAYKDIETSPGFTINEDLQDRSMTEGTVKLNSPTDYQNIYEDNITSVQTTQVGSYELHTDKDFVRSNTGLNTHGELGVSENTFEAMTLTRSYGQNVSVTVTASSNNQYEYEDVESTAGKELLVQNENESSLVDGIIYSNYDNAERTSDTTTETSLHDLQSVEDVVTIHPEVSIDRAHDDKVNTLNMQTQSQEHNSNRDTDAVEQSRYENSNDSASIHEDSSYGETVSQESISTFSSANDNIQNGLTPEDIMFETATRSLTSETYKDILKKNFTNLQMSLTTKSLSQNVNESLPSSSKRSEHVSVAHKGYAESVTVDSAINNVSNEGITNKENEYIPSRKETEEDRSEKILEVIKHSNSNERESDLKNKAFINLVTNVQQIDISSNKLLKPASHIHTRDSMNTLSARKEIDNFTTNSNVYSGPVDPMQTPYTLHKINPIDFPSHLSSSTFYPFLGLNNGVVAHKKFGNAAVDEMNNARRQDRHASAVLLPTYWTPYPLCIYRLPVGSNVLTAGPVFPPKEEHAEAFNGLKGVDSSGFLTWEPLTEEQQRHQQQMKQQWEQQHQQKWQYNMDSQQYYPASNGDNLFYPGVLTAPYIQSEGRGMSGQQNLYCAPIISPVLIQSAPHGFILPTSGFQQDESSVALDASVQAPRSQDRQEFPTEQLYTGKLLGFHPNIAGKTGYKIIADFKSLIVV
jgi:hypothetical protein